MASLPALTALLKQTHIDDHEQVLTAANSALKQSPTNLELQHVQVVALLKLDRYEDAIHAFGAGGEKLKGKARLEYAYALYKSGKPDGAAKIARQGSGRGYKHVEAQASYRTEDFRRAAELYQNLNQRLEQDAEADLRINTGAVDAQLEWADQGELVDRTRPSRREDMESFEILYNFACDSIAQGLFGRAEVLLRRARDVCSKLDDLSEEEKQAELLPITVQHVYVLATQGRTTEAESLAKSIDVNGISDASTKHIAHINVMAASGPPANPFLAQRLIEQDIESFKPDYPFHFQTTILQQNRHATALQSMKFGGTADSTAETIAKQPSPNLDPSSNSLSVVNAAAHARNQTGKDALKHILPLLERRPDDVGLVLTIVQLYNLTGNSGAAVTLLENFLAGLEQKGGDAALDVRFAPGLVGTVVSLYHASGRRGHIRTELAKAATHWRRKPSDRPSGAVHLLKAAGRALLESEEPAHRQLAADIFAELHEQNEGDRYAAAGALAASPTSATASHRASLPSLDHLVAGIDVDALENDGIAQPPLSAHAANVSTRKRPAEDSKPPKPRKIRPSRLPKDYDPAKKPDPERWLPLRDRSTYRPKGKKGKAKHNLLSQGAAPTADAEGSRPGTPGGDVVKAKPQHGGGGGGSGGNKKKKGKGGKR